MKAALLAAALVVLPDAVQAQNVDRTVFARNILLGTITPFAVVSRRPSFTDGELLNFYGFGNPEAGDGHEAGLVVRRESLPSDRTDTSRPAVAWADSRTCPGLEDAIVRMEEITLPTLDVWGRGRPSPGVMMLDGVIYDLWSRYPAWDDQIGSSITASANVNTSLSNWVEDVRRTAADCWSDTPPELAR